MGQWARALSAPSVRAKKAPLPTSIKAFWPPPKLRRRGSAPIARAGGMSFQQPIGSWRAATVHLAENTSLWMVCYGSGAPAHGDFEGRLDCCGSASM